MQLSLFDANRKAFVGVVVWGGVRLLVVVVVYIDYIWHDDDNKLHCVRYIYVYVLKAYSIQLKAYGNNYKLMKSKHWNVRNNAKNNTQHCRSGIRFLGAAKHCTARFVRCNPRELCASIAFAIPVGNAINNTNLNVFNITSMHRNLKQRGVFVWVS